MTQCKTASPRAARRGGYGLALALIIAAFAGRWALALPAAPLDDRGIELLRIQAVADASVDSARPDTALGATRALTVGHAVGPDGSTTQAFLRFPLMGLPEGANVLTATLFLDMIALQGKAEVELRVSTVREAWRESDITWSNRPTGLDPRLLGLIGPALGPMARDMSVLVIERWEAGLTDISMAISASEDAVDRGRSRTFASREALPGGGEPPRLDIAYVGAGTPHPFPSFTPTQVPTITPSPTPTQVPTITPSPTPTMTNSPTPSATPTTTSTYGRRTPSATTTPSPTPTATSTMHHGQAELIRPSEGASLAQPVGGEVWAFEWRAPTSLTCGYAGARLNVVGPGERIELDVGGLYHVYTADRPVAGGRWRWTVLAKCSNGPTSPSEEWSFIVDAAAATPGATLTASMPSATPTATATGQPSPAIGSRELWLPWLFTTGIGIVDPFQTPTIPAWWGRWDLSDPQDYFDPTNSFKSTCTSGAGQGARVVRLG